MTGSTADGRGNQRLGVSTGATVRPSTPLRATESAKNPFGSGVIVMGTPARRPNSRVMSATTPVIAPVPESSLACARFATMYAAPKGACRAVRPLLADSALVQGARRLPVVQHVAYGGNGSTSYRSRLARLAAAAMGPAFAGQIYTNADW
jgi:hypothetical protein